VTIAMCYVSPEGIVLGADSTSSSSVLDGATATAGYHYLNFNQKLFEIGDPGTATLAVLTWGWGGFADTSHRTFLATFQESLWSSGVTSVDAAATLFATLLWSTYSTDKFINFFKALAAKPPVDPNATPPDPMARTEDEEKLLGRLQRDFVVGFCLAGYWLPDRTPKAFVVGCSPNDTAMPVPSPIPVGNYGFFGAPNMIKRLINGSDDNLKDSILKSGKWNGTDVELVDLLNQHVLGHPTLPIRDAIDFVHSCIYSTIKGMKFSNFYQICGGPIELAVITTDRRFRWVRHKPWDAAIAEGEI